MTREQKAVLAHVVVDPDAWYAHVLARFGEERAAQALADKVARWRPQYEMSKAAPGYKTRAERDEAEAQALKK